MAVQYIENETGDLRGIGFFANEWQDYAFIPAYKIVVVEGFRDGRAYLNDPARYATMPLGQFVEQARQLARSLRIN